MVDSQKIKNHSEHLAKLIKHAESDSADAIKDLIDYLMLYKGSAYSDMILRKGIKLLQKNQQYINLESKKFYIVVLIFFQICI